MLIFFLLITLLHVSMRKHHRQGVPFFTNVTRNIKVKSTLIYRYHKKIKRLKNSNLIVTSVCNSQFYFNSFSNFKIQRDALVMTITHRNL